MSTFARLICLLFVTALGFGLLPAAGHAWVEVTIKNQLSQSLFVAFCWSGMDPEDDVANGWYRVEPGESKTARFDAIYALTARSFCFYAEGKDSKGKKVTWSGKDRYAVIHPTKPFKKQADKSIKSGVKVGFRTVKLTEVQDGTRENATATLTFKPPKKK